MVMAWSKSDVVLSDPFWDKLNKTHVPVLASQRSNIGVFLPFTWKAVERNSNKSEGLLWFSNFCEIRWTKYCTDIKGGLVPHSISRNYSYLCLANCRGLKLPTRIAISPHSCTHEKDWLLPAETRHNNAFSHWHRKHAKMRLINVVKTIPQLYSVAILHLRGKITCILWSASASN